MASFMLSAAIRAVKSKIGTWKAYESIREIVPDLTREEWALAIGQARGALAQRVAEATRPLNRRPTASEMYPPLAWKGGGNYIQRATIYLVDRETGARSARTFNTRTDTLRSRQAIINDAIEKVQGQIDGAPEEYPLDIVSFEYTGTYPIVPKGA